MPDDDLTPADEQVRRLLADARHTEPMPDDVVDRLDGVLAGLGEAPGEVPAAAPQRTWPSADEVAAARRRRTVRNWLVAAAAVVVVGVGINQVDWAGMGTGDDAADGGGTSSVIAAEGGNDDAAEAPTSATDRRKARWRTARLQLSADRFGVQIEHYRSGAAALTSAPVPETADQESLTDGDDAAAYSAVCDVGDLGPGHLVPVRYDGARAWLVFRAPEGDSQVVDLYLCGSNEPTRSITLPAP